MQKVDGYYLYQVGASMRRLHELEGDFSETDNRGTLYQGAYYLLINASSVLETFLTNESYRMKTCIQKGNDLLKVLRTLQTKIENEENKKKRLSFSDVWPIRDALTGFEAVLSSEFGLLDLYVITKKGGYDISELMTNGEVCFPKDLAIKVPECIPDIKAGTKCIAVSLPTAAGFHLLRANEAVLRRYWDVVTNGSPRPSSGNMGDYIKQMEDKKAGSAHVLAALKNLKNLHRNELIHPGDILESVEEAIALMNQIHTVVLHMLKEIPIKTHEMPKIEGVSEALIALPISEQKAANGQ